jgi:hypothetical protein
MRDVVDYLDLSLFFLHDPLSLFFHTDKERASHVSQLRPLSPDDL